MWKVVLATLAAVLALGSAALVGGRRDSDMNSEGAQNALKVAVADHNSKSNDLFLSEVAEVVNVQTQVVSGMKYFFTVKMAKTNCRKNNPDALCAMHKTPELAQAHECKFTVWSRPWMSAIEVLERTC